MTCGQKIKDAINPVCKARFVNWANKNKDKYNVINPLGKCAGEKLNKAKSTFKNCYKNNGDKCTAKANKHLHNSGCSKKFSEWRPIWVSRQNKGQCSADQLEAYTAKRKECRKAGSACKAQQCRRDLKENNKACHAAMAKNDTCHCGMKLDDFFGPDFDAETELPHSEKDFTEKWEKDLEDLKKCKGKKNCTEKVVKVVKDCSM